jgi:hypothetical protein
MEDGQITVLVLLLDFSQAFDMVIHGLLLCKLKNLQNYSDGARILVDSYLNVRTQFVRCGEKESSVGRVTCDVPQGSVLGPLLFLSDINDVSRVNKYSRFHNYFHFISFHFYFHANVLQIYHSCSVLDLQRCYNEISMDLQQIHEWITANELKLNPKKSQVMESWVLMSLRLFLG